MDFVSPTYASAGTRVPAVRAALVGLLALAALLVLATPALAARGHLYDPARTIGEPCPALEAPCGPGKLKEPTALAILEAHQGHPAVAYVLDQGNDRVQRFDAATGAFLGQFDGSGSFEVEGSLEAGPAAGSLGNPGELETGRFSFEEEPQGNALAIDNAAASPSFGDVYVVDSGHAVIDKFTATGEYLGQITGTPSAPEGFNLLIDGIATDAEGGLWIAEEHLNAEAGREIRIDRFDNGATNNFKGSFRVGKFGFQAPGFAVDSSADSYLNETDLFTSAIAKFGPQGELLDPSVSTEPTSGLAVELSSDDLYVDNLSTLARYTSQGALLETLNLTGEHGSGVAVDSGSETIYVADSTEGVVNVFAPEPASIPTIEADGVSAVSAASATAVAEVNPRGTAIEFHFEYGPCSSPSTCALSPYSVRVPSPDGTLGASFEVQKIEATLRELTPATTYHLRLAAHGLVGGVEREVVGEEVLFTIQPAAGAGTTLPDSRKWELVSPADKRGALIYPIAEATVIQASASGNAITYLTSAATEATPEGNSNATQVLSLRGSSQWESKDIAIPHGESTGATVGPGPEYRYFSEDLSRAAVQVLGGFVPGLSPEASEQSPYLRTNLVPSLCQTSCFRPMVSGSPPIANVTPGTQFGEEGKCPQGSAGLQLQCGPRFLTATPDLEHAVLSSKVPLLPGAPTESLYEYSASAPPGQLLKLVSVLPGSTPAPAPSISPSTTNLGGRSPVSADGARIVFSSTVAGENHFFLRDVESGETVQLDLVQSGGGEGRVDPKLQLTSSDLSRVIFTDEQRLTSDAGAEEGKPDIYRCDIEVTAGVPQCNLTDLTPQTSGESADVQGAVLGAGTDAEKVYFVADGRQANSAVTGTCQGRKAGQLCNLYVAEAAGTKLIAVLSSEDRPDWAEVPLGSESLSGLTARVSGNGEWLAFMSQRRLTGYDNTDAKSSRADEEVFLYHDGAGSDTLNCASCNPTGQRPSGAEYGPLRFVEGGLVGGAETWPLNQWIAANIPGWTPNKAGLALYQSRYLSDSGRLFFNSADALSPQDTNGTQDVYEYEPPGVGSCTPASPAFATASGGCVALISSGTSDQESAFLDASASGDDVFFLTSSPLVSADRDRALDVYDAHACSASSPCLPEAASAPPPCAGETCQAAGAAPAEATPATSEFVGPGNPRAGCPKGKVKKSGKCVAKKSKKHKKHHKKKAHERANTNRRAGK